MTIYSTPEERLANMERLTGMTQQEILGYTAKTIASDVAIARAKNDGATDTELIAIATRRQR